MRHGLLLVLALGGLASAAADEAVETSPHVYTNDDLPNELSVSVVGTLTIDGEAAGWPSPEEIEALARVNRAAREAEAAARPAPEPRVVVVEDDDFYPVSNVGPCGLYGTRCFGLIRDPFGPPRKLRKFPRGDGSPHLGPVTPVPDTIRGRPIIRHRPPWSASDDLVVTTPRRGKGGAVLHRGGRGRPGGRR